MKDRWDPRSNRLLFMDSPEQTLERSCGWRKSSGVCGGWRVGKAKTVELSTLSRRTLKRTSNSNKSAPWFWIGFPGFIVMVIIDTHGPSLPLRKGQGPIQRQTHLYEVETQLPSKHMGLGVFCAFFSYLCICTTAFFFKIAANITENSFFGNLHPPPPPFPNPPWVLRHSRCVHGRIALTRGPYEYKQLSWTLARRLLTDVNDSRPPGSFSETNKNIRGLWDQLATPIVTLVRSNDWKIRWHTEIYWPLYDLSKWLRNRTTQQVNLSTLEYKHSF